MKILLADDDEISRKIISSFLSRFGYDPLLVQNGLEAWEILRGPHAPALAICDWMMPRMTGPEVCSRLRAIKQPVRTYVILLSSRNSKLDIVKGLDAGADDYLVKPCDLIELQARLRVAQRALNHEAHLRKTIAEYDQLIRRHNMLSEIASQQAAAPAPAAAPAAGVNAPAAPTTVDVAAALADALREAGLGQGQLLPSGSPGGPTDFSVVLPLYLKRDGLWVDLRLGIQRAGAHALCRAVLKRSAHSEHELLGVLAESVQLLLGTRTMARVKQVLGLVPVFPALAARSDALPPATGHPAACWELRLPDLVVQAALFSCPVVAKSKSLPQLHVGDLVLEAVSLPGEPGHSLLAAGELITAHRLDALAESAPQAPATLTVAVAEAPETSRAFLRL